MRLYVYMWNASLDGIAEMREVCGAQRAIRSTMKMNAKRNKNEFLFLTFIFVFVIYISFSDHLHKSAARYVRRWFIIIAAAAAAASDSSTCEGIRVCARVLPAHQPQVRNCFSEYKIDCKNETNICKSRNKII